MQGATLLLPFDQAQGTEPAAGGLYAGEQRGAAEGAVLSPCGGYRLALWRRWDRTRAHVTFVLINPSTADASVDDPTIRRCIGFAKSLQAGGLRVANLFTMRSKRREDLARCADPVGSEADRAILEACAGAAWVIAGWGTHPGAVGRLLAARERDVAALLTRHGIAVHALALTQDGAPGHPLYLPATATPLPWPGLKAGRAP